MPSGWSASDPSTDTTSATSDLCGVGGFETAEVAKVQTDFQQSELGPFFIEELVQTAPGAAQPALDAIAAAVKNCPPQTQTQDDGTTETLTVTPLPFPTIGDQSVALRLKIDGAILPISAVLVIERRKDTVAELAILSLGLGSADNVLLDQLARKADARFAPVAR
jgi:hypothetical protein